MRKLLIYLLVAGLAFFSCPVIIIAEPADHIVISEIKITGGSGKSTDEFIELYNPTDDEISLVGWQLIKKTASGNEYPLVEDFTEQKISSHSFYLIVHPAGYLGEVQPDYYYTTTNSIADNNTIILLNSINEEVDKVGFGSALDFEAEALSNPGSNKSAERKASSNSTEEAMTEGGLHYFLGNSEDTDNNNQNFIIRPEPEPQDSQSELEYLDIEVPEIPDPPTNESVVPVDPGPAVEPDPISKNISYSDKIIITELFPNPEGVDNGEFIELFNTGNEAVALANWQLGDNSSRKYSFKEISIDSGAYISLKKEITRISLNNTSDAAKLYWPDGTLVDLVEYEACQEEQSYSLVSDSWVWTDDITPGLANVFEIINELPIASFEASEEDVKVGQVISFDASGSEDSDNDALEYFWNFGNNDEAEGKKVDYTYQQSGDYLVTLLVKDEKGGEDEEELKITITDLDYSDKVIINELLPACSPSDQECEFIELYNQESREVNLDGWQLTDLKKYFKFSDDYVIEADDFLVVERKNSRITLNNSGDTIFLLDPSGEVVNGVEYEKGKKDLPFARDFDSQEWRWTEKPTPGEENEIVQEAAEDSKNSDVSGTTEQAAEPVDVAIADITKAMMDQLIRVHGEVESVKSTGIYIMDELGNTIRIYIQKKTGISKPDVEPGDHMEVVGVVSETSAGLRILPRTVDDIVIQKQNEGEEQTGEILGAAIEAETIDFSPNNKGQQVKTYLFIAAGALVVILAGVLAKIYIKRRKEKEGVTIE